MGTLIDRAGSGGFGATGRGRVGGRQGWGSGGDGLRQCRRDGARHGLESLIGEVRLVDPLSCSVPRVGVGVGGSSVWHGGDLVLNAQPETSSKFHYQCPGICVSYIGDQGLEVV